MRRLAPFLLLIALAGPAPAQARGADAEWETRGDGIAIEAQADNHGRGMVRANVDIDAPPSVVFRIILDCNRAARMSPGVKTCRVVSRAADGTEIREHTVRWSIFLPTMRSTSRVTLVPDREIHFTCIGGDIRACDGAWRLEPLDGGRRTRVTYDMWATAPFAVPSGMISAMMRKDVPSSLKALRRECEGR